MYSKVVNGNDTVGPNTLNVLIRAVIFKANQNVHLIHFYNSFMRRITQTTHFCLKEKKNMI